MGPEVTLGFIGTGQSAPSQQRRPEEKARGEGETALEISSER
jgi:hypothetical protein